MKKKKQRHYFANKGPSSQSYDFSSSHVWMWELDYKESWVPKNWWFWTVGLEKTLKSPLNSKEIQPVHPKGNPILWPPDEKNWLTEEDLDAGKGWRQEEKGTTEDEMVGWHHRCNGHEFEKALGLGDGQGSQACCNPWGCKELDTTKWLNWMQLLKKEPGMNLKTAMTSQHRPELTACLEFYSGTLSVQFCTFCVLMSIIYKIFEWGWSPAQKLQQGEYKSTQPCGLPQDSVHNLLHSTNHALL